jgi:FKBP-type peptidyl-prolyl cis-trans isomerase 2
VLQRKLSFLIIILIIWGIKINNVTAATTAGWGDIVNVEYSLYLDAQHTEPVENNIDQTLEDVYLGPSVPQELQEQFPQANAGYLDKFKEGIVGAQVNQPTEFVILAKDAYSNDINHPLYNKDLYYIITLLEIIYDASAETTTTTTTTTQVSSPDPLQDFGGIIIIGGGVVLIGGIYTLWSYVSSRRMKSVFTEEKLSSNVREQTLKKERSQLKELRELTESFSGSEDTAEKSDVKFRRRR